MEKNRIRPVINGKSLRMSYSRQKEVLEMPNLIEVQKNSYNWFLEEGLKEVFADISPIADYSGHLSLEFTDFTLCEKDVKYSIPECKERDATYAAPLKVKVRLYNKEADEINEHEIFMGDLPLMTETGTFVINGAERVIVSQLVRSPGIYYGIAHDKIGKELYSCTVIPNRGAWLEYETDSNDVFYVRVDRTRKVPITVLIRALGIGTNQEIIDLFVNPMKRFWAFIAACLFLLLTACGGSTSTTEPVWQAELPNTGITVQVSGCTLEEKTASYWANPGAAGEPQSIMELYATDSAPLLEIAAPKAQVDIQFVQPVAGGMAAYDLALPVEQVDMVFLTQPEDNSTRVRFDTIYNFIVTVTSGDQIDQFLIICARNGYGSVE